MKGLTTGAATVGDRPVHSFAGRAEMAPTRAIKPGPDKADISLAAARQRCTPRRGRPVHIDIICHAAGLASDDYTLPYVAVWSGGDPAVVRTTAQRVLGAAQRALVAAGFVDSDDERAPTRLARCS